VPAPAHQRLAEHDVATVDHSRRIRDLAATAGRHLRMLPSALDDLSSAALLHDVGKLLVPAGILQKPGP
jgi:HD-GYP domain-containing protein (c-di-GMP phosphodiesterase class II)